MTQDALEEFDYGLANVVALKDLLLLFLTHCVLLLHVIALCLTIVVLKSNEVVILLKDSNEPAALVWTFVAGYVNNGSWFGILTLPVLDLLFCVCFFAAAAFRPTRFAPRIRSFWTFQLLSYFIALPILAALISLSLVKLANFKIFHRDAVAAYALLAAAVPVVASLSFAHRAVISRYSLLQLGVLPEAAIGTVYASSRVALLILLDAFDLAQSVYSIEHPPASLSYFTIVSVCANLALALAWLLLLADPSAWIRPDAKTKGVVERLYELVDSRFYAVMSIFCDAPFLAARAVALSLGEDVTAAFFIKNAIVVGFGALSLFDLCLATFFRGLKRN